jgi:hypothetical protein
MPPEQPGIDRDSCSLFESGHLLGEEIPTRVPPFAFASQTSMVLAVRKLGN